MTHWALYGWKFNGGDPDWFEMDEADIEGSPVVGAVYVTSPATFDLPGLGKWTEEGGTPFRVLARHDAPNSLRVSWDVNASAR